MTASGNSFPKTERLKHSSEFRQLLKNESLVREDGVTLYFSKAPSQEKNRIGIIVSRRVFKRAVDRNRTKRKVREFFRLQKSKFQGRFDLVVKIVDGGNLFKDGNLERRLTHLFKRAGVFEIKQ